MAPFNPPALHPLRPQAPPHESPATSQGGRERALQPFTVTPTTFQPPTAATAALRLPAPAPNALPLPLPTLPASATNALTLPASATNALTLPAPAANALQPPPATIVNALVPPDAAANAFSPPDAADLQQHKTAAPRCNDAVVQPCRVKQCKKVQKPASDVIPVACAKPKCVNLVHLACSRAVLAQAGVSPVSAALCGKRCYNAYVKLLAQTDDDPSVKKRVPWHNDGVTPSISSLSCLLDWMTTGSNYRRFRGGKEQSGETKLVIAGEVVRAIAEAGITTSRTSKDVLTKIAAIEESYRKASDWLQATGQGVEDQGSIRAAILSRCPYYYELYDVMEDRATTRPLWTNKDSGTVTEDDEDEFSLGDDDDDEDEDDEEDYDDDDAPPPASTPLSVAPTKPGKGSRRKTKPDESVPTPFMDMKHAELQQEKEYKTMTLDFRRKEIELQRQNYLLSAQQSSREERESAARLDESEARTKKLKTENAHLELKLKLTLLSERNRLRQDGVPQEEIDSILPLPAQL